MSNAYIAIGKHNGFTTKISHGYVHFTSKIYLRGERHDIPSIINAIISRNEDTKKGAGKLYKIHLMPKMADIIPTLQHLIAVIKNNRQLQQIVYSLKFIIDTTEISGEKSENFPIIVIYPAEGKENAQKTLNIIYDIFKNQHGLNITPRFNAKVTDLIYVAQGNGDDKMHISKIEGLDEYYERPYNIYYSNNIPADGPDHYLRRPKTEKFLIHLFKKLILSDISRL